MLRGENVQTKAPVGVASPLPPAALRAAETAMETPFVNVAGFPSSRRTRVGNKPSHGRRW